MFKKSKNIFNLYYGPAQVSLVLIIICVNRGSYISAHVLSNLLNKLGKRDKMRGLPSMLSLFATSLINSIVKEHEC